MNVNESVGNILLHVSATNSMTRENTIVSMLDEIPVSNSFNVLMDQDLSEDCYVVCKDSIENELCKKKNQLEEGQIQDDIHCAIAENELDPVNCNMQADSQKIQCNISSIGSSLMFHCLETNTTMPKTISKSMQGITMQEKNQDKTVLSLPDESFFRHALEKEILSLCMKRPLDNNTNQYTYTGDLPGWKSSPSSPTKPLSPNLTLLDRDKTAKFKQHNKAKRSFDPRDSPATRSMKNIIHQSLKFSK